MKVNFATVGATCFLAMASTARAQCDAILEHLNIPSPMDGDMELDLTVDDISCPVDPNLSYYNDVVMEEIVIEGGILTLRAPTKVMFSQLRFTVKDGAGLIFDIPHTQFGPNPEDGEENSLVCMLDVEAGGSAIFQGSFEATDAENLRSVFTNAGLIEFKGRSLFQNSGNIFRINTGVLKFRDDARFYNNLYLGVENRDSGFVRFSKKAEFETIGRAFDGADGAAVSNSPDGKVTFAGDASFIDVVSELRGGAVYNRGDMSFRGGAYFEENRAREDGGAITNSDNGKLTFKGQAYFKSNSAAPNGGALSVGGGTVTFKGGAKFELNSASSYGGAIAVSGGVLTFKRFSTFASNVAGKSGGLGALLLDSSLGTPTTAGSVIFRKGKVNWEGNYVENDTGSSDTEPCSLFYVEDDDLVLENFADDGDDICVALD